MKPKTLVLMVVAVTCGLGASYMTSRLLAERSTEGEERTAVLVARRQLNNGEPIKAPQDVFEEKLFVKGEEPRDAIAKLDDLRGRILKRSLRAGDFVRQDDLLDSKDPQAAFAANLPEGYRATGLRVNPESIAAGWASLPLSRVDVIQTVARGEDKKSYSKVVLQNVLVLAADQQTQRTENGSAMLANIVTLALSPEDVLKLNLAREVGTISLALRKFNDNKNGPVTTVTMEDLKRGTVENKLQGEDIPETSEAPPPVTALLPLKSDDAKPVVEVKAAEPPPTINHTLTIIEGPNVRPISFTLDRDTRRVVNQEVTRSDVIASPPQVIAPQPDGK
jgi:pilus assembly protein CpaB